MELSSGGGAVAIRMASSSAPLGPSPAMITISPRRRTSAVSTCGGTADGSLGGVGPASLIWANREPQTRSIEAKHKRNIVNPFRGRTNGLDSAATTPRIVVKRVGVVL